MSLKSASTNPPDADEPREELLSELQMLRARIIGLEERAARAAQLEAIAKSSEEMTRRLLEQTLYGVWVNVGGKIAYINQVGAEILGASDPGEVVGKSIYEIMHPDYHDVVRQRIHAMCSTHGAVPMIEEKVVGVNGRIVDVDIWAMQFIYEGQSAILVVFRDITERKRAEAAVRQSEGKYRDLVENVNDIIWQMDERFVFTYISPQIFYAWGYTPEEVIGKTPMDFMLQDEARHLSNILEDGAGKRDKLLMYENRHIRKDGRNMYLEVSGQPIIDDNGVYRGYRGVARDITKRKQAEEALRKNEEMLRRIIDSSPVPMVLYNEDEGRYYYNKKFTETFGYTAEDVPTINEWWTHAYPDEAYRESVKKRWYVAIEDAIKKRANIAPLEVEVTCKDGSKRHVLNEFSSIGDMNLSVLFDITERKHMEKALQDALSDAERHAGELDALIASIADAMMVVDRDGSIMYMNAEAIRMFGYSPDDYGKPMAVRTTQLRARFPDGTPLKYEDMLAYRALNGETVNNVEMVFNRADASPLWIIASAAPIRDSSGGTSGAVITLIDNTKRKQAEEDKNRLLHDLEERVKELRALHGAYGIMQKGRSVPEVLQEVADILPHAWQYPEVTAARIVFDGREYKTSGFKASPWVQRADLYTSDGKNGAIEIYYLEKKPDEVEGPFLNEERDLINSLAEMLLIYLDKRYAEEELRAAKAQAELYLDLMGHDLNNMHQVVLGYLELARGLPAGGDQAVFIDKSMEVLHRSTQLIHNVRKLQKLQDGVFQTQDIDVRKTLTDVESEYKAVSGKKIRLNMNGHDHCIVRANELLHDVFSNLVNNAVKHTGDGTEITIVLDVVHDQRYCRVSVEDNGPGIPDSSKERIFNRVHKGTARGMGLGLYLVRTLVDSYGGRVWVEDRVKGDHSNGARFVVMLPAVEN